MATSDNFQQAVKENRMVSVQEATIRKAVGFTIFGLTTLRLSLKVYGLLSFFLLLARCRTIEQSFIEHWHLLFGIANSLMHVGRCRHVGHCAVFLVCSGGGFLDYWILQSVWVLT